MQGTPINTYMWLIIYDLSSILVRKQVGIIDCIRTSLRCTYTNTQPKSVHRRSSSDLDAARQI